MKTTIDIADDLFARSRKTAQREGTTFRALVEEGLRLALKERQKKPERPTFQFPVHHSGGLTEEFANADWETLRDAIYPDFSHLKQK